MNPAKKRLLSLDVLRGMTVAGMILVNNAGGPQTYEPLKHAAWNGLTPCDLVFPFFLFIVGISTYLSLSKFGFKPSKGVVGKILNRTIVMLLIGLALNWFGHACKGDFLPFAHMRLTGVMQRIALCYCAVSFMALYVRHNYLPAITALILAGYSVLLYFGNGYVCDETNILSIADRAVLGEAHLYAKSPVDPEGLLSTISAVAHMLIGFWCGRLIMRTEQTGQKVLKLFLTGFVIMSAGLLFTYLLPLNKRVWSPTFVLTTCGMASMLLGALMYLIDVKGKQRWSVPFVVFGINPLFLYVLSEMLAVVLGVSGIKAAAYNGIHYVFTNPYLASLIYALCFTLLLGAVGYPLYKKKIYIKI